MSSLVLALPSRAILLHYLLIIALLLSYVAVALRVCIRYRGGKSFGLDDGLLVAALITMSLYTVTILLGIANGIGTNPSEVNNPAFLSLALKYWWYSQVLYILTSSFLLISACLSIAYQLPRDPSISTQYRQHLEIYAVIVTGIVLNGRYLYDWFAQCTPTSHYWTGWIGSEGTCVGMVEWAIRGYLVTTLRVAVGFTVLVLAKWLCPRKEEMNVRSFTGFKSVLGVGFLAFTATLIRIPATKHLLISEDFFYDCVPIAISSILEIGLGMLAVSACYLRPLFPEFFKQKEVPQLTVSRVVQQQFDHESKAATFGELAVISGFLSPEKPPQYRIFLDEKMWERG